MTVRSKRLVGPVAMPAAGGASLIGTVPAGKTWLVKDVRVVQHGGTAEGYRIGVGGVGDAQLVRRGNTVVGGTDVDPSTDPIVLAEGEQLHAAYTTRASAGPACVVVSGVELEGVAP